MRIVSWNVNGVRAAVRKGLPAFLATDSADIFLLQEVRAFPEQTDGALSPLAGMHVSHCPAERAGYSGVTTLSRRPPDETWRGLGDERFDREGRVLASRHGDVVVFNIYFPNGKKDADRLQYKLDFYDLALRRFDEQRAAGREVVVGGDFNTAHHPIDLARPKTNERSSGFLPVERAWMDRLVGHGYVDTFRHLHPEKAEAYSWWSQRGGARQRNVGWRIDYLFVSAPLLPRLLSAEILPEVQGSDHCPVTVDLAD